MLDFSCARSLPGHCTEKYFLFRHSAQAFRSLSFKFDLIPINKGRDKLDFSGTRSLLRPCTAKYFLVLGFGIVLRPFGA